MNTEALKKIPLVVFANKQDLNGLTADEILEMLDLNDNVNRSWSLYACSAQEGWGIKEGMEWLLKTMVEDL